MGLVWLALAAIALWALVRLGRLQERPGRGHWRVAATVLGAVCMAASVLAAVRGAFVPTVALGAGGLYLILSSRMRPVPRRSEPMSKAEARALLGVSESASAEEIQAAWRRLMARAHPDQGGTQGLAARLNQARDRLLKA